MSDDKFHKQKKVYEGGAADYQPVADEPEEEVVYEDPEVLTKQQINQCIMDIQDNHPLRERAKWKHILPFCAPCLNRMVTQKPNFKHALRKSLMADMGMKIPKSEEQLIEDPFLILGYGINAYFDMMRELAQMFLIITLFFIPVYMWYLSNNFLHTDSGNPMQKLPLGTIGNVGGAHVTCANKKLEAGKITVECPHGTDIDYDNLVYGVMSPKLLLNYYCHESAIWKEPANEGVHNCTAHMNDVYLKAQLDKCRYRFQKNPDKATHCTLKWDINTFSSAPNGVMTQASSKCPLSSVMYVQTPCVLRKFSDPKLVWQPGMKKGEDKLTETGKRAILGLMTCSIAVFVYLFVVIYIDYIKQVQKNEFVDFDVKTITAGDYSIEFDIDHDVYDKWKGHYYKADNPMSEMSQFKLYIQTKLEERLSAMDDLGYEDPLPDGEHRRIKIAQITFAFYNELVINNLRKRGTLIKTEKWEKLLELNDKIDDSLKDSELLDKLQTPCSIFATFETEEGVNRARLLNEQVEQGILPASFGKILNKHLDIQEASEPTDIIWENRHFKPRTRTYKRIVVYTIILILLSISGTIIYLLSANSNALKTKYPKTTCMQVARNKAIPFGKFTEEMALKKGPSKIKELEVEAVKEYFSQNELELAGKPTHYTESLQCFCKIRQFQKKSKDKTFANPLDEDAPEVPICQSFFADKQMGSFLSLSITAVIIAFNTILKKIIISAITWVGEDTYSERLASITNGVFIAQFFNAGLLLPLVNANLTEHQPKFITSLIAGAYFDYTPDWYASVGQKIVQTQFIQALIIPYVGLCSTLTIPWVKRKLDGGEYYKTKKTSMALFKVLWSGGDYVIHFKYSGLINIAYIAMFYGLGMPLLFPIAALNYFNQYCVERIIVAWYMKQPSALDDKLTVNCINRLRFAPLLFLVNGYWMLGNKQIFANQWSYIGQAGEYMVSGHFLEWTINHTSPAFTFSLYAIALYIIQKFAGAKLAEWGFAMADTEIEVDEDLPNFFKAVRLSDADELIMENHNLMNNYGFEPNDPDTIAILDATKLPKKAIQGTPWYQVLANPIYETDFNYIGAHIKEREKLIEDGLKDHHVDGPKTALTNQCKKHRYEQSDLVQICINLAYIPDEVARKINFKPGWQKIFKKNMDEYKENFKKNHGKAWEFQNSRLEKDYVEFIYQQEANDPDAVRDKTTEEVNEGFLKYFQNTIVHREGTVKGHSIQ